MKTVRVSTTFPDWPLIQQTPQRSGVWGDYRFFINEPLEQADFWVVFDGLLSRESCRCRVTRTIFLTAEPPSVKTYHAAFVDQFALVLTAHRDLAEKHRRISPPCLPWHVGRHVLAGKHEFFDKDYDFLMAHSAPAKPKLISVIASDKAFTAEHRYRREFLAALETAFAGRLDVFGRGIRDIEDKWDAIAPYKYHVVLENGAFTDYWTEKISDAFLAWSFPLYMGCPNLDAYFPAQSFARLAWGDTAGALSAVERVLSMDPYQSALPHILAARRQCLDSYNFFPYLAGICDALPAAGKPELVTLCPEADYRPAAKKPPSLLRRVASAFRRGNG